MAEANRRLLSASGYDVGISAGVASALATLDEGPVDWLVLGLHKRDVARELLEQAAKRSSGPGYRRAMGVRFHDDRVRPTPELAAVVVKPSPPRAVAAVLSDDAQPPELDIISAASLVEGHALGNLDDALARIASGLVRALGVRAAAVTMDTPRSIAVTPTTDERTADELGARVLAAAQSKAPLVMSALVTAYDDQPYDEAFETIVAATAGGVGHRPRVAIGVVLEGARPRAAILRPLLRGLAERVAEERSVEAVRARLAAEIDAVHEMGGLDTMLGIWNRSTLSRLTEMMEAACRRTGQPISTAILNVSGMTRINETYGHREGDALLRHVAEVAVYVVRGSDIVARYQDDDLALVFPGLTAPDAAHVVERIRRTIASQPVRTDDGQEIVVETTAAVSAVHTEDDDGERALARAFEAASKKQNEQGVVTALFQEGPAERPVITRRSLEGLTFGGSYRVLHQIGSGGGGGVFRGEDLGLRRPVAIKVLRAELSQDERLVEGFRSEASILASLRDPHLVQVYAFGLEDGHAYFVMELVEGESLFDAISRSRRERRPIPLRRVRMVLDQVSSALGTLHDAGIIHRDVKPANVLLDPFRDRAVLVDVGIASRRDEATVLAGTPGYMAPEGATRDVDATADVYGLAVTIYELLTLRLPWTIEDDVAGTIRNQLQQAPRPPSATDPALAPFDTPLLKALSPEPRDRWPTVETFARASRAALEQFQSRSAPASNPGRASDPGASSDPAPMLGWRTATRAEFATTRGVVFRSVARVVGARQAAAWRLELAGTRPRLAEALSPATVPLGWQPTELLVDLLSAPPSGYAGAEDLAYDLGRAVVRATFRRFFPASSATLAPGGTLTALPSIWPRYHSWGAPKVIQRVGDRATVVLGGSLGRGPLCEWTRGALEQLVVLSGGDQVAIEHVRCIACGGNECAFDVRYRFDPSAPRGLPTL